MEILEITNTRGKVTFTARASNTHISTACDVKCILGDLEHIDIILYTLYQETLDTGLLIRPVFNRLTQPPHSHTCSLTLLEFQVSICPISTCGQTGQKLAISVSFLHA